MSSEKHIVLASAIPDFQEEEEGAAGTPWQK